MSVSKEWWEYHLTPNGWVDGDFKLDTTPYTRRPIPDDRVLTVRETEAMGYNYSKIETNWQEIFRSDNDALVASLLEKYGQRGI